MVPKNENQPANKPTKKRKKWGLVASFLIGVPSILGLNKTITPPPSGNPPVATLTPHASLISGEGLKIDEKPWEEIPPTLDGQEISTTLDGKSCSFYPVPQIITIEETDIERFTRDGTLFERIRSETTHIEPAAALPKEEEPDWKTIIDEAVNVGGLIVSLIALTYQIKESRKKEGTPAIFIGVLPEGGFSVKPETNGPETTQTYGKYFGTSAVIPLCITIIKPPKDGDQAK